MIWNIQVDLLFGLYAKEDWTGVIEIESSSTLDELHYTLQKVLKFDNDHLYEFFISRTPTSRDKQRFDEEEDKLVTITLEDLFPLPKGRKLYYMFDYGDSWLFRIKKNRIKPHPPAEGVKYPILVKEVGEKPVQYPHNEDDWD